MERFCIFIKTYRGDLERAINLLHSIDMHNKENIPVVVSVPEKDLDLFDNIASKYELLTDESFCDELIEKKVNVFSPGYINQQLVKLTFWKTNMYKFYLCLDSDTYFIRDFYYKDFFYDEDVPYSNLSQWEQHFLDIDHIEWVDIYKKNIDTINNLIDHKIDKYITCANNTIISSDILKTFESEYLFKYKLRYLDILKIVPFEYLWYNQWLIKEKLFPLIPINGFFKMFHYKDDYDTMRKKLIKEKDIAKMYLGITMNSNWKPIPSPLRYEDPTMLHYLNYKIVKIVQKITNKIYKVFWRNK